MDLRDFAFAKDAGTLDYTDITVDDTVFRVTTPTIAEQTKIESAVAEVVTNADGEKAVKLNMAELKVRALIDLCVDPETSEPVFTELDREAILGSKKGSRMARLAEKVSEAFLDSGNGAEATSNKAENSSSSVASPKTSDTVSNASAKK